MFHEVTFERTTSPPAPQKIPNANPQKCQIRGSSGSPRTTGWWALNWRMEMGGRQSAGQPISPLRDVRAPPATRLISSTWNAVERRLRPQPRVLPYCRGSSLGGLRVISTRQSSAPDTSLFSFRDNGACWGGGHSPKGASEHEVSAGGERFTHGRLAPQLHKCRTLPGRPGHGKS